MFNDKLTNCYDTSYIRGYTVQKTLWGYAANMGNNISLLATYEWPLKNAKFGISMGCFYFNFLKFEQKLGQFKKIFEKSDDFAQNLVLKWANW